MKLFRSKSGETIIEVMITVIIVILAVTAAFKTLTLAFGQKRLTEDRIIAINLAREGMEAVRYIRDYSWLYYGSERRICWNHIQDNNDGILNDLECVENGSSGVAVNQLGTGDALKQGMMEYILKQKETHWFLTRARNGGLITNGDWAKLTKDKLGTKEGIVGSGGIRGSTGDPNYDIIEAFRLCKNITGELIVSCLNNSLITSADTNNITKYFRYVRIQYGDGTLAPTKTNNIMTVVVGVKWVESNMLQDVELITKLTDFYKRGSQDGEN